MTLEIDLPFIGWLTVEAESLSTREGYGFAVTFVDLSDDYAGEARGRRRATALNGPLRPIVAL